MVELKTALKLISLTRSNISWWPYVGEVEMINRCRRWEIFLFEIPIYSSCSSISAKSAYKPLSPYANQRGKINAQRMCLKSFVLFTSNCKINTQRMCLKSFVLFTLNCLQIELFFNFCLFLFFFSFQFIVIVTVNVYLTNKIYLLQII